MSTLEVRGPPPTPSAVVFLHRASDDVGDGAPNDGGAFIGPTNLLPARSTLAWLIRHGYTVRLEYFLDESSARATYPTISFDVGNTVREQGAAILAADPTILTNILSPQVKPSGGPPPAPFSVPRRRSSPPDEPTPLSSSIAGGGIHDITLPPPGVSNIIHTNPSPTQVRGSLPSQPFRSGGGDIIPTTLAMGRGTDPPSCDEVAGFTAGAGFGFGGSVGDGFSPGSVAGVGHLHEQVASVASGSGSQIPSSAAVHGGAGIVVHPPPHRHGEPGGSIHLADRVGFHPPPHRNGGSIHSAGGSFHFASLPPPLPRTRAPIEPDAMMAAEIFMPPPLHRGGSLWYSAPTPLPTTVTLRPPTASVSGLLSEPLASVTSLHNPATNGATIDGVAGTDGDEGFGGAVGLGGIRNSGSAGGLASSSASSSTPSSSTLPSFVMSPDDERDAAKALTKAMAVFHGGGKAAQEWPPFWARINSLLRFSHYAPHGPLVTTHDNAANSNRLYILLTLKVGSPAMEPFFNNPQFEGKGFEMLARLRQTYAPSEKSDLYSNFVALLYLEQGPQDSLEFVVSRIRQYASMLAAGGWPQEPQMLTMVLMKSLDDRFAPFKSDFALNSLTYSDMSIDELEQRILKWAASAHIMVGPSGSASAAAARAPASSSSDPSPPVTLTADDIKRFRTEGNCSGCGGKRHRLETCHACQRAGYVITYDPAKAQEKLAAASAGKKKKKKDGESTPSVASASTPAAATPVQPSPTPSTPVGGVAHASTNLYAVLESDDDEEEAFTQDVGVSFASVVTKTKSTSSRYSTACTTPPSHCIGSSSHVAASHAALTSVVIADSGATDHMWPDYSAFTSYRPLPSKHVTLADNNTAPVAGIGSIKILLDGHVVGVRNVLHVPSLRVPLYSLRAHRKMIGCGFIGDNTCFHVYFPGFVATVDDTIDSYIAYSPLGPTSQLPYTYRQTRSPSSTASAHVTEDLLQSSPALIECSPSEITPSSSSYDEGFPPLPPLETHDAPKPPPSVHPLSPTSVLALPIASDPKQEPSPPATSPMQVTTPKRISQAALKAFLPAGASKPPAIRSCDTPNGSDVTRHLTADQIYTLFGHRRFRNYQNFCFASKDSKFINGGAPTPTLGEYATIPKRKRGQPLPRPLQALDKVHLDIVFGDGIGRLGYRYALLFVDRATRYIWVFGMKSLHADAIIEAFVKFRAEAGQLAVQFRTDCDIKLLSQKVISWLRTNGSGIASAPAGRQSSNGLVERQWRTMVEMARSYLTAKQMPRAFWFHAIHHAARMMNCIPGKVHDTLTTPFELLHHSPPDSRLWFPLFSVGYFHHTRDGSVVRSGFQAQTLEGIAIGRSDTSNAMVFYNPTTKQYYEPDTYKLDPSRLPSTVWPTAITYDGGIFADLYRDSTPHVPEPFPPGNRVLVCLHGASSPSEGTVTSIPLKSEAGSNDHETYMILLDDGTATPAHLSELRQLSPMHNEPASPPDPAISSLPAFLAPNSKVILAKDGIFHKGFLLHLQGGRFRFTVRHRLSSKREEWGVELDSFASEWPTLCIENRLIPSWIVPTGIIPPTDDPPYLAGPSASSIFRPPVIPSTWDIPSSMPFMFAASNDLIGSASHVSAKECALPCPPSLQRALDPSHPDRNIWNESYAEEKNSLIDVDTFKVITLDQYRRLRDLGAPQAIPSMCVLLIKTDEHGLPDRAKSRIVVLGNLEARTWGKHERAAPVLKYSSLRLMVSSAVERKRKLKQADYKNAFCNPTLPDDETTIIRPPLGDPDAKPGEYWLLNKTLYGLRRSPKHWYDMASKALLQMGLTQSVHDPCLFHGVPTTADNPASPSDVPITVGLYVDDMVYFSTDDNIEQRFEAILASHFKISFMGVVNWFLGTHFTWIDLANGDISVHLSQVAFAQNLVERYRQQHINVNPRATPYRSGLPIDSLAAYSGDMEDTSFLRLRAQYQSLVGSLNWLATNTRPDLAPVTSFLAAYNHHPTQQHMDAALYAVKYLRNTTEYGIAFHSDANMPTSAFVHFPFHHDIEAYNDALPPSAAEHCQLTAYSDACWGSQLGGTASPGSEIEMFKLRSMSGYIILRAGGPIAWTSVRQERTSRSSCEAEVRATDECAKEVLSVCLRGKDIGLTDDAFATRVHNDNQGCVDWCKTTTTSGMKHIDLRSNAIRESVHLGELSIHHIPGVLNCSDIFTKELKDASHFCLLCDSFMLDRSNFDRTAVSA